MISTLPDGPQKKPASESTANYNFRKRKKNMKRATALIFAAVLMLSVFLTACTSTPEKEESTTQSAATESVKETEAETEKESESETQTEKETETETEETTTEETTTEETTEETTEATDAESDAESESDEAAEGTDINIVTLMGPTGMGMAKLIHDNNAGETVNHYNFTIATAPDQATAAMISKEADIAAVPVNLASVLNNKTEGEVLVLGVNTLGVLYVLENGDSIQSVADLAGKTLYSTGQGAMPEYVLNYILEKNGLNHESDLTVEYLAEHAELAAQMTSGEVTLGMLPVPNVTAVLIGNPEVRIALDMTEEWGKVSDTELVQGVIVVQKSFAEENPEAVAAFLEEYKASVDFVNASPDEASVMIEEAGIIPKAPVAKRAIPDAKMTLITGEEMKSSVSALLQVLFDANPASVGGKLPSDDFYYMGE